MGLPPLANEFGGSRAQRDTYYTYCCEKIGLRPRPMRSHEVLFLLLLMLFLFPLWVFRPLIRTARRAAPPRVPSNNSSVAPCSVAVVLFVLRHPYRQQTKKLKKKLVRLMNAPFSFITYPMNAAFLPRPFA